MDYLDEKKVAYSILSHRQVLQSLRFKEYVEIEEKKDEVFKKRMDFFVLAKCLREAMVRETGYRQLKRYLMNEIGMDQEDARSTADSYNQGCRTHDKFLVIV